MSKVIRFPAYVDLREPHPENQATRLTWWQRLFAQKPKQRKSVPINLAHERMERVRRKARRGL